VKMKAGRDPAIDPRRAEKARAAIGPSTELFVDANGAYSRKQALNLAEKFADLDEWRARKPRSANRRRISPLIKDDHLLVHPSTFNSLRGTYTRLTSNPH
jgi:hypothetical protein